MKINLEFTENELIDKDIFKIVEKILKSKQVKRRRESENTTTDSDISGTDYLKEEDKVEIDINDMRKLAAKIAKNKGAKTVHNILKDFGVEKLSDITPEKQPDFMKALEASE